MPTRGFWRNKKVTVTGGTGFLGSSVSKRLADLGADIFIPRSADYDLTRYDAAARMYEDGNPDIVIHLAARVGGIGANKVNPGRFFHDNMAIGLNVIEEARKYGAIDKLVVVGTTCSYPKFTTTPFKEDDIWSGYPEETNAPYGIAKRALLAMAQGYRQQYGLSSIYLIPANLYGPRDNFSHESSHVIPALIRRFLEAKQSGSLNVAVWGTGSASREFLYVEDAAKGIVAAAEHYDGAMPINLGTGDEITIRDLVDLIKGIVGYNGEVVWDHSKPDGQPRRRLDTERAANEFGFIASTPLDVGLCRTLDWYDNNAIGAV
jgi:GDP-L-fucose synthase